ncbi:MAG: CapA family protein [Clostridia bacterium]|nr:CapA family protein [Clostridia bacterium]
MAGKHRKKTNRKILIAGIAAAAVCLAAIALILALPRGQKDDASPTPVSFLPQAFTPSIEPIVAAETVSAPRTAAASAAASAAPASERTEDPQTGAASVSDPEEAGGAVPPAESEAEQSASGQSAAEAPNPYLASSQPSPTPRPSARTVRISAAGDCTLGGEKDAAKHFMQYARKKGMGWFLGGVKEVFEGDDLTIVNLEGPLTEATKKRSGRTFNFRGSPKYVEILTLGSVEACNIANNHALDYLEAGLAETKRTLTDAGIVWCGYEDAGIFTTESGVTVGLLGYHLSDADPNKAFAAITALKEQTDIVIVSMHSGVEGSHGATSKQIRFAHGAVDAGANLVLGHHPHVIGGIETYKGVNIIYSLANFCFGGNLNPKDKNTFIYQQTFIVDAQGGVSVQDETIIPCTVSSTASSNNFRPTIMNKKQAKSVFKTIAQYSKRFEKTIDLKAIYQAMA